jgi:Holliday junction resolvasome RuvABC ATP-dependent DNA helicase subunit
MCALARIIGQEPLVRRVREFARLFHGSGDAPDHVLLIGAEGMGKRTIAQAFAEELGASLTISTATLLEKKGDLTAILTSLDSSSVLFLEDIHRLRQNLKEILIAALRDFRIDLIIGRGPGARVHPYQINRFTCVSSLEREGNLTGELRDLFPLTLCLQSYSVSDIEQIAKLIGDSISIAVSPAAAQLIANVSKGSPHQAEVLIRRLGRSKKNRLDEKDVLDYLSVFGIGPEVQTLTGVRSSLDSLSGVDFERLIASLFARMGFQIEMTKPSGDGGIDIIATLGKPLIGGCQGLISLDIDSESLLCD